MVNPEMCPEKFYFVVRKCHMSVVDNCSPQIEMKFRISYPIGVYRLPW